MKTSSDSKLADLSKNDVISDNKVVSFHYRLCEIDPDGNRKDWLEDSFTRQPLQYLHGYHNVVVGLEKALAGKSRGDTVTITLQPEEAYGLRIPDSIKRVPLKQVRIPQGQRSIVPGMVVAVKTERGLKQVIAVKVGKFNVDIDLNHPLAGKNLYYEVEVIDIRVASESEIAHGHVHGPGAHSHS